MRTTLFITLALLCLNSSAQTMLKMELLNGRQVMPCKVNGLSLKFTIDTGDNGGTLSIADAIFMLKNGYISAGDIKGTEYDAFVMGNISAGTTVTVSHMEIGTARIDNLSFLVVSDLRIPMVIGQDILRKLGKIEIDYSDNLLTLKDAKSDYLNNPIPTANRPSPPVQNMGVSAPVSTASITSIAPATKDQKLLVKVNTNLYSKPDNQLPIVQVNSNTFVDLVDEASRESNFVYVDYRGFKGYINRLALETR